jgi:hypothetical protein
MGRMGMISVIGVRDAGSVLMYTHDRRIHHLHRRVMTGGQRVQVGASARAD